MTSSSSSTLERTAAPARDVGPDDEFDFGTMLPTEVEGTAVTLLVDFTGGREELDDDTPKSKTLHDCIDARSATQMTCGRDSGAAVGRI